MKFVLGLMKPTSIQRVSKDMHAADLSMTPEADEI